MVPCETKSAGISMSLLWGEYAMLSVRPASPTHIQSCRTMSCHNVFEAIFAWLAEYLQCCLRYTVLIAALVLHQDPAQAQICSSYICWAIQIEVSSSHASYSHVLDWKNAHKHASTYTHSPPHVHVCSTACGNVQRGPQAFDILRLPETA